MRLLSSVAPLVILIAASDGIVPILPEIKIDDAVYAAGKLVVTGETLQAGQQVTLDGRYSTKTDEDRQFRFDVTYLPKDCMITLSAGQRTHEAVVRGCDVAVGPVPTSASPAVMPAPTAQPHGSSSVSQ